MGKHLFQAEMQFARRELSLDDVLAQIADGTIDVPPSRRAPEPGASTWYHDVEATGGDVSPFASFLTFTEPPAEGPQRLTWDEYEMIRKALAERRGEEYLPLSKGRLGESNEAESEPADAAPEAADEEIVDLAMPPEGGEPPTA